MSSSSRPRHSGRTRHSGKPKDEDRNKHKSDQDKKKHEGDKDKKKHKSDKDKDKDRERKRERSSKSKKSAGVLGEYFNMYCAVYTPEFGNYYHWALAAEVDGNWSIFHVVQAFEGASFGAEMRQTNPRNSNRCHRLVSLGEIHRGWWNGFLTGVASIPVPGDAVSWNCQDYVMDIWGLMWAEGMITAEMYSTGRTNMIPFYGQDFGGDEEHEEEEEEEAEQQRPPVSDEYVYDSDED